MYHMNIGTINIPYEVIRSKRTSYGISLSVEGEMLVRAPIFASEDDVLEVLEKKKKWIEKNYENIIIQKQKHSLIEKKRRREGIEGEVYPYLGKAYELCIQQNALKRDLVMLKDDKMILLKSINQQYSSKELVYSWYRNQATKVIRERVEFYAQRMELTYGRICIKEVRTRWGSCSSKRNLNFNWKLIMLPLEIVDYVVVHELCHLREMNHSAAFWMLVSKEIPHYKKLQLWLRENGNSSCISFGIDI